MKLMVQRQPVHDFDFSVNALDDNEFEVTLTPPEDFQRKHLGNVNLVKVINEVVVGINTELGYEDKERRFTGEKFMVEIRVKIKSEITDFQNLILKLSKTVEKRSGNKIWQKWEFSIGTSAKGFIWTCYVYEKNQ